MLPDPTAFLDRLFENLEHYPGQLDHLYMDHVCYRLATDEEYTVMRDALAQRNELLVESIIGKRLIATFRLSRPFRYKDRIIDVVELPAPKKGSPYPTGYEHVEFVVDRSLEDFRSYLTSNNIALPSNLDTCGLAKINNRTIRIKLLDGSSVKFHEYSLAEVIRMEGNGKDNFG